MANVIDVTVKNDLCAGCGVCVALCPSRSLKMELNKFGEYNPIKILNCIDCGLCLKICPFSGVTPNEDEIGKSLFGDEKGIHHKGETGYYLTSYVGAVSDIDRRLKSASGGLATWFLEKLLHDNVVDAILCVKKSTDGNSLYKFIIAKNSEDVRKSAGSVYYPTNMSEVIRYVLEHPGKYAAIGVPCFVKALRLASMKYKKLSDSIVLIAGLTCGQVKNSNYTKYMAHIGGLDNEVKEVSYRCKDENHPANEFFFKFTDVKSKNAVFFWGGVLSLLWGNRAFMVPSCDFCDDIFAECADVTFMDAWLPEYRHDSRGTSLVIVRSNIVDAVFQNGINENSISIQPISINRVIDSQGGVIANKRSKLAYRMYLSKKNITKRVAPSRRIPLMEARKVAKHLNVRLKTRDIYFRHQGDYERIDSEIKALLHESVIEKKLYFVWRAVRFAYRKITYPIRMR